MIRLTPSSRGSSVTSSTSSRISVRPQPRPRGAAPRAAGDGRAASGRPRFSTRTFSRPPPTANTRRTRPSGTPPCSKALMQASTSATLSLPVAAGVDRQILGELLERARRDQLDVGGPRDDHLHLELRLPPRRPAPAGAGTRATPSCAPAPRAAASVEVESRRRAAAGSPAASSGASRIAQRTTRVAGSSPAVCSAATSRSNCSSCSAPPPPPGRSADDPGDVGVRRSRLGAQRPGERVQLQPGERHPAADAPDATETTCGSVTRSAPRRGAARAPPRRRRAKSRGVEEVRGHLLPVPGDQASCAGRRGRPRARAAAAPTGRRAPSRPRAPRTTAGGVIRPNSRR